MTEEARTDNTGFASGGVIRQKRTGCANLELLTSIQVKYWLTVLCSDPVSYRDRHCAKRGNAIANMLLMYNRTINTIK